MLFRSGRNYGQGSSREHAALAPRYLGLRVVLAVQFARIHRDNLIHFGVLPLTFVAPEDRQHVHRDDVLVISDIHRALHASRTIEIENQTQAITLHLAHDLSARGPGAPDRKSVV